MLIKLTTLIMAFSLFTATAGANTHEGLKAAFDEFNYATTVEWDQKDPSFLEAKKQDLAQAIEAQGLSREELITVTKSLLNNGELIKSLDRVLEAVSINDLTPAQAQDIMAKAMSKSQMNGASWDGGVFVFTPVGLLVLILIVIIVT